MILEKMLDFDDFEEDAGGFDDFGACCWLLMILNMMLDFDGLKKMLDFDDFEEGS